MNKLKRLQASNMMKKLKWLWDIAYQPNSKVVSRMRLLEESAQCTIDHIKKQKTSKLLITRVTDLLKFAKNSTVEVW